MVFLVCAFVCGVLVCGVYVFLVAVCLLVFMCLCVNVPVVVFVREEVFFV